MIWKINKNFKVKRVLEKDCNFTILRHRLKCMGFTIIKKQEQLKDCQTYAQKINDGVRYYNDTAGGRIRFKTDSRYIALSVRMPCLIMPHMPLSGSAGFDLYIDSDKGSNYFKSFIPPVNFGDNFEGIIYFPNKKMRNITIYFPLYSNVFELKIRFAERGNAYRKARNILIKLPVVFYGGSHVQGGCASKPGNCYQGFLSRWLDADYINLGFSGSALGEKEMAKYIAKLHMSAFVMDYDHNAPTPEYLQQTHYNFYSIIREKNPELPIILLSKQDYYNCSYYVKKQKENIQRRKIIIQTYNCAVKEGDKNIYFIDGKTLFGTAERESCTVDCCHLNYLGFYRIAKKIYTVLNKSFKENEYDLFPNNKKAEFTKKDTKHKRNNV